MAAPEDNRPGAEAVGKALVEFALNGTFPEEDLAARQIEIHELDPAIAVLEEARMKLEAEIKAINDETFHDVNTWFQNAASLEDDIKRSRRMADDIEAEAHAPQASGQAIWEAEQKAEFLAHEMNFSERLYHTLESIKAVKELLDKSEEASRKRSILESLLFLEDAEKALDKISVSRTCRAMKLLDLRIFEITSKIHEVFEHIWKALVSVDFEKRHIVILESHSDESMTFSDALKCIYSYNEVQKRMTHLWHEIDRAIIRPRMDMDWLIATDSQTKTLFLKNSDDRSTQALLKDLETLFQFLSKHFPQDFIETLSHVMVPELCSRLIREWLEPALPASLQEMETFETVIGAVKNFVSALKSLSYNELYELEIWAESVPKVWLTKCRETALDTMRSKLASGIGAPRKVEKVETQKVTRSEGKELAVAGGRRDDDGWDTAWNDDENGQSPPSQASVSPRVLLSKEPRKTEHVISLAEDDGEGADAWGWGDGGNDNGNIQPIEEHGEKPQKEGNKTENEDQEDAWGWGNDDADIEIEQSSEPASKTLLISGTMPQKPPSQPEKQLPPSSTESHKEPETREMTLREVYHISSMPDPVLDLIASLINDGAMLTLPSHASSSPVAKAAPGLFALPTLILAMFRAVGPYYYALYPGGNMFLYNDSMYLAECLSDLVATWKDQQSKSYREDLSDRARALLRLDNDISVLTSFAVRAYGNELATQKTIVRDLLGGAQNFLQDPSPQGAVDAGTVELVAGHIEQVAQHTWKEVLAPSVWYQATGQLCDEAARKFVADVLDMPGIGQDDAYAIAGMIESLVGKLDRLFLPPRAQEQESKENNVPKNEKDGDDGDAWGWDDEEGSTEQQQQPRNNDNEDTTVIPMTAQFAPTWLRLKYLSQVLQSNLNEVRFMWLESELSLHFTAAEVVDLVEMSFEQNGRTKGIVQEIKERPFPLQKDGF